jgi:hypothetical protein
MSYLNSCVYSGGEPAPESGQETALAARSKQTSVFSNARSLKPTLEPVVAAVVGAFRLIKHMEEDPEYFEMHHWCSAQSRTLPQWHKHVNTEKYPTSTDIVDNLKISDKFDNLIVKLDQNNSEWIPSSHVTKKTLICEMRQELMNWETLLRYNNEKELSSGCIDPVLVFNFLHENQDVKSFLDVGMGAAGPLAVAFAYFSFRIDNQKLSDVFNIMGTEVLLLKFVKAHILVTAISKTIARMKSKSLFGWASCTASNKVKVELCFSSSPFGKENNFIFTQKPDCVLFNNQEIHSTDLHQEVLNVGSRYLLSIRLNHYDFTKVKLHLAGIFPKCASFRDANLIVFRKFDDTSKSFHEVATAVSRFVQQLPASTFSEVLANVQKLYKSFAKPQIKSDTFQSIISEHFAKFIQGWSISEFYFFCPPVLMSTILYCLLHLLADIFKNQNDTFPPHRWLFAQRDENADIFTAWARVESKIFTGVHNRHSGSPDDFSLWQTDAQWFDTKDGFQLLKSLKAKKTLWRDYFQIKANVPLAPPQLSGPASSSSSSTSSSSSSSSVNSDASYAPIIRPSDVNLDTSTDHFVMFLHGEHNILDYLKQKHVTTSESSDIKKMFAHIKSMSKTILDETFQTILDTFIKEKEFLRNESAKNSKQAKESDKDTFGSRKLPSKKDSESVSPEVIDPVADDDSEDENDQRGSKKVEREDEIIDPVADDDSESGYIWNNCQPKQSWNVAYLSRNATLLKAFNIQREKLNSIDDKLCSTDFLKNIYLETEFKHSVGEQWYGMMVNEPYSGHNHTFLSKSGIRYFQNLGLCDKFHGVHKKFDEWREAVAGKHWSFLSIQFINASFLCINFAGERNQEEGQSDPPAVNETLQSTVADQFEISKFIVSPRLQKLIRSKEKSWTLDSIEAFDNIDSNLTTVKAHYFVITITQIIVFHLSCGTRGSHNIDLSRAVVKFEDAVANMMFHAHINDMHANHHFHLKLFYSAGKNRKRQRSVDDDDSLDLDELQPIQADESPSIRQFDQMMEHLQKPHIREQFTNALNWCRRIATQSDHASEDEHFVKFFKSFNDVMTRFLSPRCHFADKLCSSQICSDVIWPHVSTNSGSWECQLFHASFDIVSSAISSNNSFFERNLNVAEECKQIVSKVEDWKRRNSAC